MRRATNGNRDTWILSTDFYPRSPCGERPEASNPTERQERHISIHALLAESDQPKPTGNNKNNVFLSTLSLRRATLELFLYYQDNTNFYPRSPCGERHQIFDDTSGATDISIHALLAESDCLFCVKLQLLLIFLSTLSLRRATICEVLLDKYFRISIHALLAESDAGNPLACRPCCISIHALLAESD